MDKMKVGIAGLGRIGWSFHARTVANHPACTLAAVMDIEPERRAQAQSEYGCAVYDDFETMLQSADLELVVVATPTHLHREMALAAFARGLHVILEKPMALNHADAAEIVRAAGAAGRKLTVYQPHRLADYFQQILRVVASGRIGEVYWVRRAMFKYVRRNDWQSLVKFGGGMLNNYGAHGIDQVLALIGFDIRRLFCDLQRVAALGDAEDVAKVVLEGETGRVGEVEISQASVWNPYGMIVWGSCGGVILNEQVPGRSLTVRWFDPGDLPAKALDDRLASEDRRYPSDAIDFEEETVPVDPAHGIDLYADFVDCIRTGRAPAVRPEESLAVMGLLDRCRADSGDIRDAGSGVD